MEEKMKTVKELRKELKELNLFEELTIGNLVIQKCTSDYAVRNVGTESDMMRDYSAYTYGFKLKWVIDMCISEHLVKEIA